MAISYNRLWKLLIDRGIKKTELKTLVIPVKETFREF